MRDLAVDEVEDVGDDHDHAGRARTGRAPSAHGRGDVDEDADERQDVGVDAQRHAGAR